MNGSDYRRVGGGIKGVDDAGLPCLDFFSDDPVFEIEVHDHLPESWEPGELP